MNQLEKVSRILPLILADGEFGMTVPLKWALPARSEDFAEPELVVLETEAAALEGELCVQLYLRQDTYFVDAASSLVKKATSRHRITHLFRYRALLRAMTWKSAPRSRCRGPAVHGQAASAMVH